MKKKEEKIKHEKNKEKTIKTKRKTNIIGRENTETEEKYKKYLLETSQS